VRQAQLVASCTLMRTSGAHPLRRTNVDVTAQRLADRDALDVEDQVRVGGNVRGSTTLAVRKSGGDGEATLATGRHASDTDVPALDDLTDTELEGERLALLVGWKLVSCASYTARQGLLTVKDLAVLQLANVAHLNAVALLGGTALALLLVINGDTADVPGALGSLLLGVLYIDLG
jgi:hypothetical protein